MDDPVFALASVIQTAVAPVFLLAGIAGFLNVMSMRLGRIVDRARVLERRVPSLRDPEKGTLAGEEMRSLWRRVKLINWAMGLCTASALMVCTVVVGLFVGAFWHFDIDIHVVVLFVCAMVLLIAALLLFIREVQLATGNAVAGMEFEE